MSKHDSLYYDNCDFKLGNHEYHTYMCEGMRGRGKSTYWLKTIVQRTVKDIHDFWDGNIERVTKRFVYVRRKKEDLQNAISKGIFNDVFIVYPKVAEMVHYNIKAFKGVFMAQLGDEEDNLTPIGYYYDLNNVKGISTPDVDTLLFDEFIADKRIDYKGGSGGINEPEILARLDDTLFRKRENWVIMLGNSEEPSNPYCEYFHVPFGVDKWTDKERGIWYEYDKTPTAQSAFDNSVTGRRWKGTTYAAYAKGEQSLVNVNDDFIANKPKQSKQLYNLKVMGSLLTIWLDGSTGLIYITDDCALNKNLPIYAVFNDDMSVNAEFMSYNPMFLKWLKMIYGRGNIRFNTQKTYALYLNVIKVL